MKIFMVLSSWPESLREFTRFTDECRLSAGWPPTLRPSQSTWAVSPLKTDSYHPHPPSPLLLLLSPSYFFTVPRRVEGWVDLGTAVEVCSPCPRLYFAVAVAINTTVRGVIRTSVLSHRSQMRWSLGHCDLIAVYVSGSHSDSHSQDFRYWMSYPSWI